MIKLVVDVSNQSYLHVKNRQLVIEREGKTLDSIPIEDLGLLLLHHPAITISQSALIACQKNNAVVLFCDERHCPYSLLLPLCEGHSLHQKVLKEQISLKPTNRKRIWQQIIKRKIQEQIRTLDLLKKDSSSLQLIHKKVRSDDRENHESQAAQHYWKLLFGKRFKRNPDLDGINCLLNYGYAVIRATVARALVGTGMHPALGIKHDNQYNSLCLADDVMEPFRPWIDLMVFQLANNEEEITVNPHTKKHLLEVLNAPVTWQNKTMPFMVASHHLAAQFKQKYSDQSIHLSYPSLLTREQP